MRISYSNVRGKKTNTSYPFIAEIKTADDLKNVAAFDHVCAIYKDGYNQRKKLIKGYRSNKTFQDPTVCRWTVTTYLPIHYLQIFRLLSGKPRKMFKRLILTCAFLWFIPEIT